MITLNQVRKYYDQKEGFVLALSCDSLTLGDGEVIGILGANGAGKTTLLKAIMGFLRFEGEILIDGAPVNRQYQDISFITEEGSFLPFLTPLEYGEFQADFWPRFDMARYRRLLEFFGLAGEDRPIAAFSNGQQAKIEVAAGFSRGARYILMDEPFLGKDVFTRRDFLKMMAASLHGEETILLCTHQIEEIEHFLDRAVVLSQGKVAADLTIDELRESGKALLGLMQEISGYDGERCKEFLS